MNEPELTAFQRTKVQMEFVVPLLRDLQDQLGSDVVLEALRARLQKRIECARENPRSGIPAARRIANAERDFGAFASGDALEYDVIASDKPTEVGVDVSRCAYAELMTDLDVAEIGHLLLCSEDFVVTARAGTELSRSQTLMQGARHCDFRFKAQD